MIQSYEYIQFLNDKILEYLPHDRVKVGDKINFRCPLCGDSHKNSSKKRGWWYKSNASFYCFNCSTGMSGIRFLQTLSGQDYKDIKREFIKLFVKSGLNSNLSAHFEVPNEEPSIFELKSSIRPEWKKPLTDEAKAYLDGRMVTKAPFLREDFFSTYGKNGAEYIMIPWVVNGVDAYYQLNDYLKNGSIKYIFPKNKKKLVYGLDNIDMSWPYIIVFEGVYDSLFVKNAIAVGTKSITDYQIRLIKERYPNHQICLSFDNDKPGIDSMVKAVASGADFKYFRWFNSNTAQKDINEYVLALDDPKAFSNSKLLERLLVTPLQMKMWLAQNGHLSIEPKKRWSKSKSGQQKRVEGGLLARKALLE